MTDVPAAPPRKPIRWHIAVFLAPAVIIYSILMIIPLVSTLQQSTITGDLTHREFFGLGNFVELFTDERWSSGFWNAFRNNIYFFIINMLVQNPIGILLAALLSNPTLRLRGFYRTAIFVPTILSFVIVGFVWKLLLSPTWGIPQSIMKLLHISGNIPPLLGKPEYALTTLSLVSVWQYIGIPMMLVYAALLSIPDEVF